MTVDPESSNPPFDIIDRNRVYDGFLRFDRYRVRQRYFEGGFTPPLDREVLWASEAVAVICYDPILDSVVLVQQARLPAYLVGFGGISTEIVAGLKDHADSPEANALREVQEETGLVPIGDLVPITYMITTPGHSTETVHVFCARVDAGQASGYHGVAKEHEDIRLLVLSFDEFVARMEDRRIANSFTLVAGFWLRLNRDRLRAEWRDE